MRHLDNMAKVMLATGLIVAYGYVIEAFIAWYSGNAYEQFMIVEPRCTGPYAPVYWALILCNVRRAAAALVQARARRNVPAAVRHRRSSSTSACGWSASSSSSPACTATSCRRRGACTTPTFWDWSTFVGTIGLFLVAAVPVHPLPADDLDLRDADACCPSARAGRRPRRGRLRGALMATYPGLYGLIAEFDDADGARRRRPTRARQTGLPQMDAYSPFPIEELAEALGFRRTKLPLLILLGGITGSVS